MASNHVYSVVGLVQGRYREEVMVCQFSHMTNSQGAIWFGGDMFAYSLPVILTQFTLIFFITAAVDFLLKPLKQNVFSAQLIGGIIMRHSIIGDNGPLAQKLFPPGGRLMLEIFADVGLMFHLFILGVRIEATMLKRIRRNVAMIGISCFVLPYVFGGLAILLLPNVMVMDETLAKNIPFVAAINSITSFPVICSLLTELKLLNSEVGKIATWAAMCCDFCGYIAITLVSSVGIALRTSKLTPMLSILLSSALLVLVFFGFRPLVVRIGKNIPPGQNMKEMQFLSLIIIVLLSGLCAEALGQPAALGTFILGVAIPDGPPIGSAMINKLETLSTGILLPAKFAITGLSVDLYSIKGGVQGIVIQVVIILGYVGKFTGALIPALYFKVPPWDALTLALIMCCKGVVEVSVYIMMKENGSINNEAYALLLISLLVATGIGRPLVWYLYDPSAKYFGYRTNSVMFTDINDELRMMVCVHKEDNAPAILNLLEASNAMRYRRLSIFVLHLLELQGRAAAMLVPNIPEAKLSRAGRQPERVANAFKNFAHQKQGSVLLEHFTSIAPYATMHDDICSVALDRGVNILIIPFHKQWAIDGAVGASFPSIRMVNQNVLHKAPCSVGVLIDRGQVSGNQSLLTGKTLFRVVLLFLGGSDDCEALAFSSRMADHPHISFTLIWLRLWDNKKNNNEFENLFDIDMIERFRAANRNKQTVKYREEVVKDAVETTRVLRSMEDNCDLCIVGRYHDPQSPLILGLTEWSECPELGFIGDLLATSDFRFSVLVVQHQPPGSELIDNNLPLQPIPSRAERVSTSLYEDPLNTEEISLHHYHSFRSTG